MAKGTINYCTQCGRSGHVAGSLRCPVAIAYSSLITKKLKSGTFLEYDRRDDSFSIDFPDDGIESEATTYGRLAAIRDLKRAIRFLENIPKEMRYRKPRKAHL